MGLNWTPNSGYPEPKKNESKFGLEQGCVWGVIIVLKLTRLSPSHAKKPKA